MGTRSFAAHPVRLTALVATGNDANGLGASLSFGRTTPAGGGGFGSLSLLRSTYEDEPEFGLTVNPSVTGDVELGWQHALPGRPLSLCPTVNVNYTRGPEIIVEDPFGSGERFEFRTNALGLAAGAWLGGVLSSSPGLQIIPAAGLQLAHLRAEIDGDDVGGEPQSESESDTFAVVSGAIGFAIGPRWTIRPVVAVPIGLPDADATLQLGVSWHFGGR